MHTPIPPGLLATDLDGTLAVAGIISTADCEAAAVLKAEGIPILVITGRNPESLKKVKGLWDVADEVLFSSGAGILAAEDARPLGRVRLTAGEVTDITAILDTAGEDFYLLNPIPENHRYSWVRHRRAEKNPDFDRRMDIYSDWGRRYDGVPAAVSQILVIIPPGSPIPNELLEALSPWSVFYSSSPIDHQSIWLEIFPSGVNKGNALAAWCKDKGIPRDRVLAVGNDFNDESMLSWAGMGRVVEGAPKALMDRYPLFPPAGSGGFEAAVKETLEVLLNYLS